MIQKMKNVLVQYLDVQWDHLYNNNNHLHVHHLQCEIYWHFISVSIYSLLFSLLHCLTFSISTSSHSLKSTIHLLFIDYHCFSNARYSKAKREILFLLDKFSWHQKQHKSYVITLTVIVLSALLLLYLTLFLSFFYFSIFYYLSAGRF